MTTSRLVRPSFRASNVSRSSTASGKRTDFLFSSILTIYPSLLCADDEPEPAALRRMPRVAVLHTTVGHQFRQALVVGGDGAYPREAHQLPAAGVGRALRIGAILVVQPRSQQTDVREQQTTVIANPLKERAERVLGQFHPFTHCRYLPPSFS